LKLPQYQAFPAERERYALRFTCDDCALFDPDDASCSHGFPTEEHRLSHYEVPGVDIVFCKDFELR
jgi:hypothetical protein